jgi:hypothetical protein
MGIYIISAVHFKNEQTICQDRSRSRLMSYADSLAIRAFTVRPMSSWDRPRPRRAAILKLDQDRASTQRRGRSTPALVQPVA